MFLPFPDKTSEKTTTLYPATITYFPPQLSSSHKITHVYFTMLIQLCEMHKIQDPRPAQSPPPLSTASTNQWCRLGVLPPWRSPYSICPLSDPECDIDSFRWHVNMRMGCNFFYERHNKYQRSRTDIAFAINFAIYCVVLWMLFIVPWNPVVSLIQCSFAWEYEHICCGKFSVECIQYWTMQRL